MPQNPLLPDAPHWASLHERLSLAQEHAADGDWQGARAQLEVASTCLGRVHAEVYTLAEFDAEARR